MAALLLVLVILVVFDLLALAAGTDSRETATDDRVRPPAGFDA